jgi:hypothetical protein
VHVDAMLRQHLDGCRACAAEERLERLLRRDLGALCDEPPPPIDVGERVMRQVAELARPRSDELPTRQLGWAALVAAAWVAALVGGLVLLAPDLPALYEGSRELAGAVGGVLSGLGSALMAVLTLPLELARAALTVLKALGGQLAPAQPVGVAVVALAYVAMAATITLVVGRDLRRALPAPINGRKGEP